MSDKQSMLEYGSKWFNGLILPNSATDSYNHYTRDINAATYPATREQLLDNRHKFLVGQFVALSGEVTA